MAEFPAMSHVAVTVTDLAVSIPDEYRHLGSSRCSMRNAGGFHHTVYLLREAPSGLHQHPATNRDDRFDEHRPGLDHLSFGVLDRAELKVWQTRLRGARDPHGEIVDAPMARAVLPRPDNIALEFFAPPG